VYVLCYDAAHILENVGKKINVEGSCPWIIICKVISGFGLFIRFGLILINFELQPIF